MISTTFTRLVLDGLKPRDPGLLEFLETIASLHANTAVEVSSTAARLRKSSTS